MNRGRYCVMLKPSEAIINECIMISKTTDFESLRRFEEFKLHSYYFDYMVYDIMSYDALDTPRENFEFKVKSNYNL